MFDLGWSELLVVGTVAILVVGPNEMPRVVRGVTGLVRKVREMANDFQNSMEEIANDADIHKIKKQMLKSERELESILDKQNVDFDDFIEDSEIDALATENLPEKSVRKSKGKKPKGKKPKGKKPKGKKPKVKKERRNNNG